VQRFVDRDGITAQMRKLVAIFIVCLALALNGCIACLPQYMAPPEGPVSACYPVGSDPYIPMDHNPSPINPWDFAASIMSPMMYGPAR
jgi:hypothetical protein